MPPSSWTPPAQFEEYRLVRLLGHGTMGTVWLARDENLDRPVAIKFVSQETPDPSARERFFVEARAVARLHHPNVVSIFRVGMIDTHPYLVSEYVRGLTLDRLKAIPPAQALELAIGLARGLAAAHRRGVIHRDVKPANALLTDENEVKLLDFGLAKLFRAVNVEAPAPPAPRLPEDVSMLATITPTPTPPGSSDTQAGLILGTPAYLAPELWRGEHATFAADVYAFGASMYDLLVGHPPHEAPTTFALAIKAAEEDAPNA
jgi:serine/threonine protein kinase